MADLQRESGRQSTGLNEFKYILYVAEMQLDLCAHVCMICVMTQDKDATEELTERVIFPASKQMLKEITDYRFEQRCETKAEAIRRLIAAGLKAERTRSKR